MKLKTTAAIIMHDVSLSDIIYFYTNAFEFDEKLTITQKKFEKKKQNNSKKFRFYMIQLSLLCHSENMSFIKKSFVLSSS